MILVAAALAALASASSCPADLSAPATICRALAAQGKGDSAVAATEFEAVAAASAAGDPQRDRALAAAGNMWLAAGQPGKAALALDRALAGTGLQAEQRGEALLDRARAAEAQNDLKTARAKLRDAAASVSEDPFYWYFSAALAIREGDRATAQSSIARALTLAPSDPTILFEAGHVAHFAGDDSKARAYWSETGRLDPDGPIGKAARDALKLLAPEPANGAAGAPKKGD